MLRWLLVCLLLAWASPGIAQEAVPKDTGVVVGKWMERFSIAAQEPVASANDCLPTLMQSAGGRITPQSAARALSEHRACFSRVRASMTRFERTMASLEPLPRAYEEAISVDTREMIRSAQEMARGSIELVDDTEALFQAMSDNDLARAKTYQSKVIAGTVVLLNANRLILSNTNATGAADMSAELEQLSLEASDAARMVGASFKITKADIIAKFDNLTSTDVDELFGPMESEIDQVVSIGLGISNQLLVSAADKNMTRADSMALMQKLSAYELEILQAIERIGLAMQQID